MMKPKTVDLEDSNIANLGGDDDKAARENAALTEKAWSGLTDRRPGDKDGRYVGGLGIRIWRIEKFKVVKWPRAQYGKFYDGDAYIVLRAYKKTPDTEKISFDVHFWLGKHSSQDEQGTAAYKTVELDDLLDQEPVQHRETQGHESSMFLSYWKPPMQVMKGGVDSGFNKVDRNAHDPTMWRIKGTRNFVRMETFKPPSVANLDGGDAFIVQPSKYKIFVWNGMYANLAEKMKAADVASQIKADVGEGADVERIDQGEETDEFWAAVGGKGEIDTASAAEEKAEDEQMTVRFCLQRVSDASGEMKMTKEWESATGAGFKDARCPKSKLDSDDVFILDVTTELYVWVGKGATAAEKRKGFQYATKYLKSGQTDTPIWVPVTTVKEGAESLMFNKFVDARK